MLIALVGGGAQFHSYRRNNGHILPLDTVEASGPTIGRRYRTQQVYLIILVYIHEIFCPWLWWGGAQYCSYRRTNGQISPLETVEASGPTIGRRYRPQQVNLIILVYIHEFFCPWLWWGGRPILQLQEDQWPYPTAGHCGGERDDDWTTLPATTSKLDYFGNIHDLQCSLLW
jgi:hypothetical protein